jgi:hypothetical protein
MPALGSSAQSWHTGGMAETPQPSKTKRIVFLIMFIIGMGMFFVTTAGPLSGPAMSWEEAMVGLVPGALLLVIGHLLHTRALAQQQAQRKAAYWWVIATVFLLGLGTMLVVGGKDAREDAERELSNARAEQRARLSDPYGGFGGYDNTSLLERDVEHYETAVNVGYGVLGFSLLFAVGTAVAVRRSRAS